MVLFYFYFNFNFDDNLCNSYDFICSLDPIVLVFVTDVNDGYLI